MSNKRKESGTKIDISKIDLEKEKEKIAAFPALLEFAHTVGSVVVKPEDKGRIKGNAISAMHDQTDRQFQQLFDQMQTLVEQANYLKKRVELSERIYAASMGFRPVIGKAYYLYQRESGEDVLSMVGKEEWGNNFPYKDFIGEVKLLSDHTWEVINIDGKSYSMNE